ncbi:aminoglycoside phosphotransferase family protein [Frankia sp. Mgl5]|uniref:aminoglycoside phosphotransferase family protein n=1 Tax=Frankia sp. Mgl5 TaxID=2933793 RepID=UPI00200E7237|nr:aminoglycoside phosphotransferase family protein [Frankia sp. Mgl5]MCK9931352.1 aminoglycoside phosphotransferase family protein [Frankia sp. Mgl5]
MVRRAIERHVGTVTSATAVDGGQNNDLAAVVHGGVSGPVFVKAVRGTSRPMRWLRNEITAGMLADGIAPAVIFSEEVEADDLWLIVGFEYLPGRPADLTPGSVDLAVVGRTLDRISALPAPGIRGLHARWTVPDWWSRVRDAAPDVAAGWDVERMDRWTALAPAAVEGDRLAHTDLHADQFILGPDGAVHVIDWGWPAAAAPWVDTAFLVIRLIDAGHSPAAAEAWAAQRPGWTPDDDALTAFAAFVAGLWTYRAVTDGAAGPWVRAARDYAAWRAGVAVS